MKPEVEALFSKILNESDPIEKGKLLNSLHKDFDVKIKDISSRLGYTQSHVCNLIRLLRLPDLIIDGYYADLVHYTHLLLLSRLHEQKDMIRIYEITLKKSLSTTQLEDEIRLLMHNVSTYPDKISPEVEENISQLFKKFDDEIQVKTIQTRLRSKVIITLPGDTKKTSGLLKKIGELNKAIE